MNDIHLLEQRVFRLLRDEMALDVPGATTDLIRAGYIDSLLLAQLLMHLESEFSFRVSIEDLDIEQLRSVRGIAKFVGERAGRGDRGREEASHGDRASLP